MDLDDPHRPHLLGGYRIPYDPRKVLRALEQEHETDAAWEELWTELYHQGDVGEASYAAVPHLVRIHAARGIADWNTYALIATIEDARHNGRNPELLDNLRGAYEGAWRKLVDLGPVNCRRSHPVCSIIGVIAIGKGQLTLGQLAVTFTEDERKEMLENAGYS